MILGAGETSELTARALAEQGAGTIFVANRHADRARSLAERFGGSVVGLDGLPEQLVEADIVLSSTSSPHPIVGRDELELVMAETRRAAAAADRHRRPARHRCRLRRARRRHALRHRRPAGGRRAQPRHARRARLPRATELVEEEIHRFARWLGQLDALPSSRALREHGNAIVEQVLAENDEPLGVGLAARPRAGRGDRAGDRQPAPARADDPAARPRRRPRAREPRARPRAVRAQGAGLRRAIDLESCAEVHDLSDRRPQVLGACAQLMRLGTRRSALALAQAELVATLLGGVRDRPHPDRRRPRRGPPDKSRWVARLEHALLAGRDRPRGALRQGRAGRARRGPRAARRRRRARPPRMSSAARARSTRSPAGARVGTVEHPARGTAARRAGGPRGHRRCAATSTRASQSSPIDSLDAIVLARAGLQRLGPRGCRRCACSTPPVSCRRPGQGILALEGRSRRRGRHARADRAGHRRRRFACLRAERALAQALDATATRRSAHTPRPTARAA